MVGGDLTRADEWTVSLLTNPEVLAVDQTATHSRPVIVNGKITVWVASPKPRDLLRCRIQPENRAKK